MSPTTLVRPATVLAPRRRTAAARSVTPRASTPPQQAVRDRPRDQRPPIPHVFRTIGQGLVCEYEPD